MATDIEEPEESPVYLKDLLFEYDLLGVYEDPDVRPEDDDEYNDLVWPLYGWLEEGAEPVELSELFAERLREWYGLEFTTAADHIDFMRRVHAWWREQEQEEPWESSPCQDEHMTANYPPRTNTLALVGFIASFMIPVVGIVLGVMARRQIAVTHEGGRGLARAAVYIGAAGTTFQVIFFIVWLSLFSYGISQAPIFR